MTIFRLFEATSSYYVSRNQVRLVKLSYSIVKCKPILHCVLTNDKILEKIKDAVGAIYVYMFVMNIHFKLSKLQLNYLFS